MSDDFIILLMVAFFVGIAFITAKKDKISMVYYQVAGRNHVDPAKRIPSMFERFEKSEARDKIQDAEYRQFKKCVEKEIEELKRDVAILKNKSGGITFNANNQSTNTAEGGEGGQSASNSNAQTGDDATNQNTQAGKIEQ